METQDKGAFDKRIRELLKLTGKLFNPKPSDVKTYWLAAERYPAATVFAAMGTMSREHVGHFTPGELGKACLLIQNTAKRRSEEVAGRNAVPFDYDAPLQVAAHRRAMEALQGMGYNVEIPE